MIFRKENTVLCMLLLALLSACGTSEKKENQKEMNKEKR
jgi:uncharacterized lipoprotein